MMLGVTDFIFTDYHGQEGISILLQLSQRGMAHYFYLSNQ